MSLNAKELLNAEIENVVTDWSGKIMYSWFWSADVHVPNTSDTIMEVIKIKYFSDKIEKLDYIDEKSDWIDLRAAEDVDLKQGEFKLIPLGIGMQLPKGYEAHIVPRSSTFKNFGIIQTNHQSAVDGSYCGDDDQWKMPV